MKIQKKFFFFFFFFWGGGSGRGVGLGGVRVDVNEELKFLGKIKKNRGWGREAGVRWGGRVGGGGGQDGCECNVGSRGVMWGMENVNQE